MNIKKRLFILFIINNIMEFKKQHQHFFCYLNKILLNLVSLDDKIMFIKKVIY
jgi:acetone carboxylase gamma subunit